MATQVVDNRVYTNVREVSDHLKACIDAGLVAMMHGSPGIGKSAIARKVAEDGNLELIDCRLAQFDPTDLNGFPRIDGETGRSFYAPPRQFPLAGDSIPAGKRGWLLFLDELSSAPIAVQAAAYKLVLDRMIGEFQLHPDVHIVCAGNLTTDGAIVNRQGTAMQSRLIHFLVKSDYKAWLDWADMKGDIDQRILAYVRFKKEVNNFDPNHNDNTFACERTWEFVSKLIKNKPVVTLADQPLLGGAIGSGVAQEFIGFCQIYKDLITVEDILKDPENIAIPEERPTLYALSTAMSKEINQDNVEELMKFINRLDIEFQVITLHNAVQQNKALMITPAVKIWRREQGNRLRRATEKNRSAA